MKNDEKIADKVEEFLGLVVSEASELDAAPRDYFILLDRKLSEYWVLGFLFENEKYHREALENGICYWIHNRATGLIESSEISSDLKKYIVFYSGNLPDSNEAQQKLYSVFASELEALGAKSDDGKLDNCHLCNHSVDAHEMRGHPKEGETAPTEGWMICPNKECRCFRTWSLSNGDNA